MIGSKKNLQKSLELRDRVELLRNHDLINKNGENPEELPRITIKRLSELLSVNRSSVYYSAKKVSEFEITVKHRIDELHTNHPTWGTRQLSKQLQGEGFQIGRRRTKRYMEEMAIYVTYPKPNLSKPDKEHNAYPYLLRHFAAQRPNEAWSIDITYIRLRHGFVYLTAIIDWYSRCIVGWELDDTLAVGSVIRALKKAFKIATPKILNSDQGSQFTSNEYIKYVQTHWDVKISMDGIGRWADNIYIERWFRTLKYDEVYLKEYENIKDARKQIGVYINDYNTVRLHSSLGYKTPASVYYPLLLYKAAGE